MMPENVEGGQKCPSSGEMLAGRVNRKIIWRVPVNSGQPTGPCLLVMVLDTGLYSLSGPAHMYILNFLAILLVRLLLEYKDELAARITCAVVLSLLVLFFISYTLLSLFSKKKTIFFSH